MRNKPDKSSDENEDEEISALTELAKAETTHDVDQKDSSTSWLRGGGSDKSVQGVDAEAAQTLPKFSLTARPLF